MAYSFNAEPRVVKQKPKYRKGGDTLLTPIELEKAYVNEEEEKFKAESMEKYDLISLPSENWLSSRARRR